MRARGRRKRRSTARACWRTPGDLAWLDRSRRHARLSGRRLRTNLWSGLGGGCRGQTSGYRGPRASWGTGLVSRRRALLNHFGSVERILAAGGSALGEVTVATIEGVGSARFVYTRDPEGNICELQAWM